jgi:hypothetical protein
MTESENKSFTSKEDCEECRQLRSQEDSAREAKAYLAHGIGTGYRPGKSRSRQPKQVREQMNSNENAVRLAQAKLRLHEINAHEGGGKLHEHEVFKLMQIVIRDGRDRP